MSAIQVAQLGDYGYPVQVNLVDQTGTAINVSGATTKQIVITEPDGTQTTHVASFVTDGTDGKIKYTLAQGDLGDEDEVALAGDWHVQGRVLLPGVGWRTGKGFFTVKDNQ